MKADYQRSLTHCYMRFSEEGTEVPDNYQLRILASSRIEGILPMTEEHVDNRQYFRYEITSLMPFRDYSETHTFRVEDLRTLFGGLLDTMMQAEDYLLEAERLLLDPDYLYVSWETGRIWAAYNPFHREEVRKGLTGLTEYLLRIIGCGNQEAVIQTCRFLHALQEPGTEPGDLRKLLEQGISHEGGEEAEPGFASLPYETEEKTAGGSDLSGGEAEENVPVHPAARFLPDRQTVLTAAVLVPAAGGLYAALQMQRWLVLTRVESAVSAAALAGAVALSLVIAGRLRRRKGGETDEKTEEIPLPPSPQEDVWDADGAPDVEESWYAGREDDGGGRTVLLGGFSAGKGEKEWLLRPSDPAGGLAVIPLTGSELLIGQRGGPSDVPIDDPTVSRIHARLVKTDGVWYLSDMGSRNGTTVDGKKAVGREAIPLSDGSRISFARCGYTVCRE